MKYSSCKQIDQIVRQYLRQCWTYKRGRKHGLLSPPECKLFVSVPGTPSDRRAAANFQRDIYRLERLTNRSADSGDANACVGKQ